MTLYLWITIGILLVVLVALLIKIHLLQKSADEICTAFTKRLSDDTNTLLDISGRDSHMLVLANEINKQLRRLRFERHQFQQGDSELKQAITNISHDLRTPLTAINGYLDLLQREDKGPAVEKYLDIIKERTEVLKSLTEELFRFSVILATPEDLQIERVNLSGVLEESIAGLYAALTQRGITPQIIMPPMPIYRELDKEAMMRVFSNLISNALKYSDGDLIITMTSEGSISFANEATILDTVTVEKLFDRFYTVESGRNSTGLGLSIAKLLTERMGGRIEAEYENQRLTVKLFFNN